MSILGSVSIGTLIAQILPPTLATHVSGVSLAGHNGGNRTWQDDNKVCQVTDYEYQFGFKEHPEIIDWLTSDCVWPFYGYTGRDIYGQERAVVIFNDIRGSIEFKLRFVE
jgi:hypothetical protein